MRRYFGLIHKQPESDYGVSFPDFPGCIAAGETLDEACFNAEEALNGHIGLITETGGYIPKPSSLAVIAKNPRNRGAIPIEVDVI